MLLGIDIGQSSCKASLLGTDGTLIDSRSASYPTRHHFPGWAEQDPDDWVRAATAACSELLGARPPGYRIDAVACTSATHNAVLLDDKGNPVRPCILLSDVRAADDAAAIEEAVGDVALERGRNRPTAGWTLPQLRWIARTEPDVWRRVRRIVFAKDYVRQALTGDCVTDWIDAEGSLLFDAARRVWDETLCAQVPVSPDVLPRVVSPAAVVGTTRGGVMGLGRDIPVIAGCSDTAAEAFAAGANQQGAAVVKLATAGNVNVVCTSPAPSAAYFTYSHVVPGLAYHTFGTNAAAASRAWFQSLVGAESTADYATIDANVAAIAPGADGLLFHPYLAGERAPVFDTTLRASFLGLSSAHGRAHLARAVLEGVALSLADCAGVAHEHGLKFTDPYVIGGGARSDVWVQIVADALGLPVTRPALPDASAGAALLAGAGSGVIEGIAAAAALTGRDGDRFEPCAANVDRYRALLSVYREARDAVAPLSRTLHALAFPGSNEPGVG
ncbi:MAG: FGGY family carbohydrate kinase [Gaiellales bacterium]